MDRMIYTAMSGASQTMARQAAVVEVGASPLAAMVEETIVVVLGLQRLDLAIDESVELGQIGHEFGG